MSTSMESARLLGPAPLAEATSSNAKPWHEKATDGIDSCKNKVVTALGVTELNRAQLALDSAGNKFETKFEAWGKTAQTKMTEKYNAAVVSLEARFPKLAAAFKSWSKSETISYKVASNFVKFVQFLVTLPFKAARNIAKLLYQTLKAVAYGLAHPIEGAAKLAQLLVKMAHALTLPETYVKMGAGMIGAGLAQLALGNAFSSIAVIIGAVIMAGGLSAGALVAALAKDAKGARMEAALNDVIKNGKQIPEAMMTGFLMALLIGAIQKAATKTEVGIKTSKPVYKITQEQAKALAREHAKQQGIPSADGPFYVNASEEGTIGYSFEKFVNGRWRIQGTSMQMPNNFIVGTKLTSNFTLEQAEQIAQGVANEKGLGAVRFISINEAEKSIGFTTGTKASAQGWSTPIPPVLLTKVAASVSAAPGTVAAAIASVQSQKATEKPETNEYVAVATEVAAA